MTVAAAAPPTAGPNALGPHALESDAQGLDANEPNALDRLTALLSDDLTDVNRTIVERMDSPVEVIPQLAGYIVASGGKRLRPLLTLASARMCGHGGHRHVGLATAVEFIHTATLLHDDVVDESEMRRGRASANEVFGNQSSVLVGDFLFCARFRDHGRRRLAESAARTLSAMPPPTIAEGEVHQLATTNDLSTTEEQTYLRGHLRQDGKTVRGRRPRIGAIVADQPESEPNGVSARLRRAYLGMAFQLDRRRAGLFGPSGGLWARRSATISAKARSRCRSSSPIRRGDAEPNGISGVRTLEEQRLEDGDLDQAIDLMHRHGVLDGNDRTGPGTTPNRRHAIALDRFADSARSAQALGMTSSVLLRSSGHY